MAHQIEDVEVEEEVYDENADEDFNPEAAHEDEAGSSSSEDEAAEKAAPKKQTKKRKSEAVNELDSGDEATIQEQRKKKKRRKDDTAPAEGVEDEDSGGEGGLIKTRAQRLAEKVERKHRKKARDGEVTVDVEQLWEDLSRLPIGRQNDVLGIAGETEKMVVEGGEEDKENAPVTSDKVDRSEMMTIKRRIEYAGEVTEIEEEVPRSSKEAQHYLAVHPEADPNHTPDTATTINRPIKRPSLFEPNPTAIVKGVPPDRLRPRAPSRLDVVLAEKRAEEERQKKAEKMTTVQKSALDWRGFVAGQEGLKEELDVYGKSKRGYLEREEFLGRAQFARDVQAREARLKG